jgi:transcriptional regulator with XRE-family HTH domain
MRILSRASGISLRVKDKTLGQNVCKLRTKRRINQIAFADRAGISRRQLQTIEAGQVDPTLKTLRKLVTAFRCSWDDLLGKP